MRDLKNKTKQNFDRYNLKIIHDENLYWSNLYWSNFLGINLAMLSTTTKMLLSYDFMSSLLTFYLGGIVRIRINIYVSRYIYYKSKTMEIQQLSKL